MLRVRFGRGRDSQDFVPRDASDRHYLPHPRPSRRDRARLVEHDLPHVFHDVEGLGAAEEHAALGG